MEKKPKRMPALKGWRTRLYDRFVLHAFYGPGIWLDPTPGDDWGFWGEPWASRESIWYWWGVDLQDMSRLPQDPRVAQYCLHAYVTRKWGRVRAAPGDLWRLANIALGYGDPTGKPHPDPMFPPDIPVPDPPEWARVIDWTRKPPRKHHRRIVDDDGFIKPPDPPAYPWRPDSRHDFSLNPMSNSLEQAAETMGGRAFNLQSS